MLIQPEDIDDLKAWLKSCLAEAYGWGSECENLTKYVVALVKKVKTPEELRTHCKENLHVFFNDNTQKFIDELCNCIVSKAYLQPYCDSTMAPEEKSDNLPFIVDKKPDPMLKERERSRSRSPRRRSRSPKRSPLRRFRSRSRSRSRERYNRRKRSRSPRRRRYSRSGSPPRRTPPRDLRDALIRKQAGSSNASARQRCRDFDEQGFCIQGELCPYDHGSDPVILDSTVPPYNPIRGPIGPAVPEYNPMEPDMRHPPPPSFNNWNYQPGPPPNGPQRDLMSVPRNVTPVQRVALLPHQAENQKPRFQRGKELEVRKIPRNQNNIATLNEFFSKFGTVTNIQVNFQGCPESALVSFSNNNEAVKAYRSPEAVLGNRFVRLFWHNPGQSGLNQNNNSQQPNWNSANHHNGHKHTGGPRSDVGAANHNNSFSNMDDGAPPKKIPKPAPESLKKDNQAEKTKQFVSKKGKFIDGYLEKRKALQERYEKCSNDDERQEIQLLIDELSTILEKVKPKPVTASLVPEIQTEKQLLDAELDIYTQIQQGNNVDSKEVTDKIIALRRRAKALGLIDASNVWHGKMEHKGILLALKPKPKLQPAQLQLDKRTKTVAILAGDLEMAGLCKHFSRHGKIVNVVEEDSGPEKTFIFTFATRKFAEAAMNRGSVFRGGLLKWSWKEESEISNEPKSELKTSSNASQNKPLSSATPLDGDGERQVSEDHLLGEDDEQDDEGQSRSWRH